VTDEQNKQQRYLRVVTETAWSFLVKCRRGGPAGRGWRGSRL